MDSKDEEKRIAMTLARRAYLYGAFHVVFGGGVHEASAAQLFGENTAGALAWLAGKVAADEGLSEKSVGLSLRTMTECVAEAVACVGEHSEGDAVSKATVAMEEDFPKLFQVPGDSYVRPWESPYTSTDGMLFRGSTLDVRSFYHQAGFRLQTEQHFPDDHVSAMMDYMARMSPVSYTHLDVYKRQALSCAGRTDGWLRSYCYRAVLRRTLGARADRLWHGLGSF